MDPAIVPVGGKNAFSQDFFCLHFGTAYLLVLSVFRRVRISTILLYKCSCPVFVMASPVCLLTKQ